MAGSLEVASQLHDGVIVDALLNDTVELDRAQAGRPDGLDAFEHPGCRELVAGHLAEDFLVEAVEADRHALQARLCERPDLAGQEGAVGGESQILHALDPGDAFDELGQIVAQQRLAAGDADLLHARTDEDADQALDLLEVQDLGPGQEVVPLAEDLGGHAVDAAEVAAVGDRDPQVSQRPLPGIDGGFGDG